MMKTRNKILAGFILAASIVLPSAAQNGSQRNKMNSENYTGDVYVERVTSDEHFFTTRLTFCDGAINDWHIHPGAMQTMVALSGTSVFQIEGEPVRTLLPGESVTIPADVKHWNGAAAGDSAVVMTISGISEQGHIKWLGKVEDSTYKPVNYDEMIVRISEIEIYPQYYDEYIKFALNVGETSTRIEPGVIGIFPMVMKRDSTQIRIIEIYADQDAYEKHIASEHFQVYKQGTLQMVKSLDLVDTKALKPEAMKYVFRKMNN